MTKETTEVDETVKAKADEVIEIKAEEKVEITFADLGLSERTLA
jgi:hypothetical protein